MKVIAGIAAVVVTAVLAFAPVGGAAQSARLEGTFAVTGTVTASTPPFAPAGTVVHRNYTFKSLCAKGPCANVRLTRETSQFPLTSKLHQTSPGVYKGTEADPPLSVSCPGVENGAAYEVTQITIRIVASSNGRATKIKGTANASIPPPPCPLTFQNGTITGKR